MRGRCVIVKEWGLVRFGGTVPHKNGIESRAGY